MFTFYETNRDLSLDANGLLATVDGLEAYANIIGDYIRTVNGELQLNTDEGIDYFGTVFATSADIGLWASHVRYAVQQFDFVVAIKSFDYNYDSTAKKLTYTMVINTDLGDTTITSA